MKLYILLAAWERRLNLVFDAREDLALNVEGHGDD